MSISRIALVLGMTFTLLFGASTAQAAKKKDLMVKGVITDVAKKADDKDTTLTVKVANKKDPTAAGKEQKITITKDTKIELVSGKKGAQETKTAKIEDVTKDSRILVVLNADKSAAEKITVTKGKKSKS